MTGEINEREKAVLVPEQQVREIVALDVRLGPQRLHVLIERHRAADHADRQIVQKRHTASEEQDRAGWNKLGAV
jgi:hypothetical protein